MRSCMFLQMLKIIAQFIASTSSPQRKTCIRATRDFKFNLLRKWPLMAFSSEKSITQIAILGGKNIMLYQSCIGLCQFVCHSNLLPHMCQASKIILFSQSCRSVSVNSKSCSLHVSLSSLVYWDYNNILSRHNLVFVIRSLSLFK